MTMTMIEDIVVSAEKCAWCELQIALSNLTNRAIQPRMSGYTGTLLDQYRQCVYEAVSQPGDPAGLEVKSMKISQPKAYKGQDNINIFDEWVNQILRWFRIYKVTGPIRDGDRVMYAGACLEDLAGQWFDQEVESPDRTIRHWTFEDLVCALFMQFIHEASAQNAAEKYDKMRYSSKRGALAFYNDMRHHAARMVLLSGVISAPHLTSSQAGTWVKPPQVGHVPLTI